MLQPPVRLIVGLGNPGPQYAETRHNVGANLVAAYVNHINGSFKFESKFKGDHYRQRDPDCHFLIPTTYMNLSGEAVLALAHFYKIPPESILVVHDELDLPVGTIRLKQKGGHGGHNGLRNIIARLGTNEFLRLRVGIGHPGDSKDTANYVLRKPSKAESQKLDLCIDEGFRIIPDLLEGKLDATIQTLHSKREESHGI